jgi:glutamate racemase
LSANQSLPIGVFDSGMGGLTVLAALQQKLPNEAFVYLGDTARLPYGTKSPVTVRRYAAQAAQQLVARGIKALVVACNTASAFALLHLQQEFAPLPVFGVLEPGARAAIKCADESGVLVLATESTILGGAYQRALTHDAPHIPVFGRPCPLWVTLAEQGPQSETFTHIMLIHYLRGFVERGPRTVLLGCTHFPVFRSALETLLEAGVSIVDSAETTAVVVADALDDLRLRRASSPSAGNIYLATDGIARFAHVGSHFLGAAIGEVELVDL